MSQQKDLVINDNASKRKINWDNAEVIVAVKTGDDITVYEGLVSYFEIEPNYEPMSMYDSTTMTITFVGNIRVKTEQ